MIWLNNIKLYIQTFVYLFKYFDYTEAKRNAKQKLQDYKQLELGMVRCEKCSKYFSPVTEVGICPHIDYIEWLKS